MAHPMAKDGPGRPGQAEGAGPGAPFRHAAFAVIWTATVVSNIGTWMHDVAAGWLMTSLSPTPLMVALVQTATTLPIFLFALPAGALADILDRRRLVIVVQGLMLAVAATLGLLVLLDLASAGSLLLLTFLMGCGAAVAMPAWQAIVPSLVPREALRPAVALNSLGVNIARAIGPALGGLIIAGLGIWAPFLLNALSFLCVIAALAWWRPPAAPAGRLPPEHLLGAVRAGLRYLRASPPMRATLVRAFAFFLFASAFWALLPLIARTLLGAGPALYGGLLGCVGAGAVAGAMLLPSLTSRLGPDRLVVAGSLGSAATLALLALLPDLAVAAGACLLAGASWLAVLSSLNVSAQTALPDWVRARGLSVFVTVFFGSMSLGSLVWGQVASLWGIPAALLAAAAGMLLAIPAVFRWKLGGGEGLDLAPSLHWPTPAVAPDLEPPGIEGERGPVLVTVEYRIDPQDKPAFLVAMDALAGERRRDGAFGWGIFEDIGQPGRLLETFLVESWLEHQRQHARVTRADAELQAAVGRFHQGEAGPRVEHFVAAPRGAGRGPGRATKGTAK